jgi:uncharacterized iron-regulated membrane protein
VTFAQWVGLAAGLLLITLILGLVVWAAFHRADTQAQRRRAMGRHPATNHHRPDDEQDRP